MKEAAGEANMTIITIALLAVVLVAGGMIVRSVLSSTKKQSCCTAAGGTWSGGSCTDGGAEYEACIKSNGKDGGAVIE